MCLMDDCFLLHRRNEESKKNQDRRRKWKVGSQIITRESISTGQNERLPQNAVEQV